MKIVRPILITLTYLILASGGTTATAGFTINLEFNTDGVLPSSNPGIPFFNNTGSLESTLYSVSGGVLQQRTFSVNGNASYIYPNFAESGGPFTPTEDLVLESRIRISQINGTAGAYFQAFDGAYQFSVHFSNGGVVLATAAGDVPISVDVSTFHTYRLESSANSRSLNLFIDGGLVYNGFAKSYSGLNGFDFGDGISTPNNGADADYDYIRISSKTPTVLPVPAPTSALILGLGAVGVFLCKRRFQLVTPV